MPSSSLSCMTGGSSSPASLISSLSENISRGALSASTLPFLSTTILSACADRLLQKKLISSVFLTGEGFANVDWAKEFLKKLCNKRKVFSGQHLFADGAALVACDSVLPESRFPYLCICEGRLSSTISLYALQDGRNEQLILASAGSNWYEAKASAEFILDDIHTLELLVTPFATQRTPRL